MVDKKMHRVSVVFLSSLVLTSLAFADLKKDEPLREVSPSSIPDETLFDGDMKGLQSALERQIEACKKQDLSTTRTLAGRTFTRKQWCLDSAQATLEIIKSSKPLPEILKSLRERFFWFQSTGKDQTNVVTFTGYNSPTLEASLTPTERFKYPVYRTPKGSTAYSRKQIDIDGVLKGRGLEIAYTDSLFELNSIQVEGSGFLNIKLPSGDIQKIHLNYAAQNGMKYVSTRRILKDQGVAEEFLTMPGQRRYFKMYPEKLIPTLIQNPSYVFFNAGTEPPLGVDRIPLTPGYSIAIDLSYFPAGLLSFVKTQKPVANAAGDDVDHWQDFSRLVVTQDTGGAIKGPGRVDFYWGEDEYSNLASGTMNQPGELYFAVVKPSNTEN